MLLNWTELGSLVALLGARPESALNIRRFQERQLRKVVGHSFQNVPFYRERLENAGLRPEEIRTLEDLRTIPLTDKEGLRQADPRGVLSRKHRRKDLISSKTTGSTGVPLEVFKSWFEYWLFCILRLRSMRHVGYRPRQRVAKISLERYRPLLWRLFSYMGFYRQWVIPMTLAPAQIAEQVLALEPDVVVGLPTLLALAARELQKGDSPISVQFAISGAELLTPGLRRQIEAVFGRVYNFYASIEAQHPIAVECLSEPVMHVNDLGVILEILDRDGNPVREGERGEVVLTSLLSFAMPIIRYRMGDLATAGSSKGCPCGYPGTVMQSLEGRRSDFFLLPDGKEVLAIQAAHVIQELADWILQYELVQETARLVLIRAVPLSSPSSAEVAKLQNAVQDCFGSQVSVEVRLVSLIEPGPGGKFRVIRTKLGSPYDAEEHE